jgi:hypothetical protein
VSNGKHLLAIACCLAILGILTANVAAQESRGTITGTVTDPKGAVVPGVAITLTNTATNATRTTITSLDFRRKKGPNNSPSEITKPSRLPIACRAHKPQPICAPLQFW